MPDGLDMLNQRRARQQREVSPPRHGKPEQKATDNPAFVSLPINEIAVNPENPTDRYEGERFEQLVESMREAGQQQAVTVVPRRVFLAVYPQHTKQIGTVPYVVVMGNRRRMAAAAAGLGELTAWIKEDLNNVTTMTIAAVVENYHRVGFKPVQEGHFFKLLVAELGSQTAVAKALGITQGTVSQRIALADGLTEELAEAVDSGEVQVRTARVLARMPAEDQSAHLQRQREERVPDARSSEDQVPEAQPAASTASGMTSEAADREKTDASTSTETPHRSASQRLVAEAASGKVRLTVDPGDPVDISRKLREKVDPEILQQLALLLGDPADI